MERIIYMLGYASDIAGARAGSGKGPEVLQNSESFAQAKFSSKWQIMVQPDPNKISKLAAVADMTKILAASVEKLVKSQCLFAVFGGDHSSAIGTWSGAHAAVCNQGDLGLIWIDAHMDSHTPQTSETGNIHGMPLACLLGYGDPVLVDSPKLKPENVCLIGVRSYESGEAELLKKLNLRIFFMEEVQQKGIDAVIAEAIQIVTKNTVAFGVSLDVDAIDPKDAPGTGVAEANGILGEDLCGALKKVASQPKLIGVEIVEFDPSRDRDQKTEILISNLLAAMVSDRE